MGGTTLGAAATVVPSASVFAVGVDGIVGGVVGSMRGDCLLGRVALRRTVGCSHGSFALGTGENASQSTLTGLGCMRA